MKALLAIVAAWYEEYGILVWTCWSLWAILFFLISLKWVSFFAIGSYVLLASFLFMVPLLMVGAAIPVIKWMAGK